MFANHVESFLCAYFVYTGTQLFERHYKLKINCEFTFYEYIMWTGIV